MALRIYGSLAFIPEWNIADGNSQKLLKTITHLKKMHTKLNDIDVRRKRDRGKFVNVCTEDANVVCYWMGEDCIFKQDWNLQLNNSSKS